MILIRLKEYADTRMKLPSEMYGESPVRWVMDLDANGALLGFISRGGDSKANMRGLPMTVPQQNVNRTMNIKANLLVDNGEYVLGIPGAGSNDAKVADRHQAFKELTRCCAEDRRRRGAELERRLGDPNIPDRRKVEIRHALRHERELERDAARSLEGRPPEEIYGLALGLARERDRIAAEKRHTELLLDGIREGLPR